MGDKEQRSPKNFDLDDILKEFQEPSEQGEEEDVRVWNGDPKQPEAPLGDTLRLDDVAEAVREQTTPQTVGDTVRFAPIEEETVTVYTPPVTPKEETAQPYSDQWEPEYEEPMGEYTPAEPIVFRPKSRMQELKKKLIEGPEKRFYELEELGTGRLQIAIFLSFIVAALAIVGVLLYEFGLVGPEQIRLMVYTQVLALMLSALLGSYQLLEGVGDLFRLRFSLKSLIVFSLVAALIDGVLCLQEQRVPCSATFCLHMAMSLWNTYQRRTTEKDQMDTLRKAARLDSLVLTEDYYEGLPGYLRGEGQVEDFMDFYGEPSGPEKVMTWYGLIALLMSIGCGVWAGNIYSMAEGLRIFSIALLVAVPISGHIALSRPASLLQRRLKKHGTVICGWQGVLSLCRKAAFPLADEDLFPAGSTKLNGVKFCGDRTPDEVVAYAAAVICADGGTMAPLMSRLLEARNGYHYDVQELRGYPGGIGGIVNREAVLAGSALFMQEMGVEIPKDVRVKRAVYVAIDGKLSGVFAVNYARAKSAAAGITSLCAYRGLTNVMTTSDFMLTPGFLKSKFGVNTKRIAFPARDVRRELSQKQPDPEIVAAALMTREDLAGRAYAVTGSRALRSSCIFGTVVHILGGVLGLLIVAALILAQAQNLLTAGNILLYQLVWLVPGLLITEWTRSV